MTKCELCKCIMNKKDLTLLPYSKGDYFCKTCYKLILGVRRCKVCNEEFYYTKRQPNKEICFSLDCYNKYQKMKRDELIISTLEYLSDDGFLKSDFVTSRDLKYKKKLNIKSDNYNYFLYNNTIYRESVIVEYKRG